MLELLLEALDILHPVKRCCNLQHRRGLPSLLSNLSLLCWAGADLGRGSGLLRLPASCPACGCPGRTLLGCRWSPAEEVLGAHECRYAQQPRWPASRGCAALAHEVRGSFLWCCLWAACLQLRETVAPLGWGCQAWPPLLLPLLLPGGGAPPYAQLQVSVRRLRRGWVSAAGKSGTW